MGLFARMFGLGKTYEELSPTEREWVDHCGYTYYDPNGWKVRYNDELLAKCKEDCEVNEMALYALQKNLGLPPITATADEMRRWVRDREQEIEMEKLNRRLKKYENQRRSSLRNSRHRSKKSRVVRGKSELCHRNNGKVSYS